MNPTRPPLTQMQQPDATDWKIIDALRKAHQPNSAIADELGVSEGMIRRRLARLKTDGILTVRALINPDVLANQQVALIAVNVAESKLLDTKAAEISTLEEVLNVSIVTGRYDLMVEVLVDSNHGLVAFLTESLASIDGLEATESFLLLKSYSKFV